MDRPQVITRRTLENPPAEQATNIQRGQAFTHDGVWAGPPCQHELRHSTPINH